MFLFGLLQEGKVFVPRDPSSLKIVPNHKNRHFPVGRNDDRARDTGFDVRAVAPFLAVELEARTEENRFKGFPMLRCELRHRAFTLHFREDGPLFESTPRRTAPFTPNTPVSGIFQNLSEGAVPG